MLSLNNDDLFPKSLEWIAWRETLLSRPDATKAALRIWGDSLDPDEISRLLGASPTTCERKGDRLVGKNARYKGVAKTGGWRLVVADCNSGNLDAQIKELFAQLSSDLSVWREIGRMHRIDVFCGVFMKTENDGLVFNPTTLRILGERGARLDIDIYDARYN